MKKIQQSIAQNKQVWDYSKTIIGNIIYTLGAIGSGFYVKSIYDDILASKIKPTEETQNLADKLKKDLVLEDKDYKYIDIANLANDLEKNKLAAKEMKKKIYDLKNNIKD